MSITVASFSLTPCGCFYRATLAAGDQVIGTTLVCGRTPARAMATARAIAARLSASSSQPCP